MRKVIIYTSTSLDGYIARPDGNIDWLYPPGTTAEEYEKANESTPEEDHGYETLAARIDTTLMGHNSYKVVAGFDLPFPYTDTTNYVFSRSATTEDDEHVKFITGDIPAFVQQLKKEPGKDIWLIGGGQINSLLLEHGLVDEMILTMVPITLGQGIPLFAGENVENLFELQSTNSFDSGFVQMTYNRKN